MQRDSVTGTFLVAALLCVACSVLVSAAAVGLRGKQEDNKAKFQKRNILLAAGLYDESKEVDAQFGNIKDVLIDLETGEIAAEDAVDESYDPRKAAKDPSQSVVIPADLDLAGIKRREKFARVYLVKNAAGDIDKVILPVYGKGLWSTLYGYVALEADLNTVVGLTFYEHKETPGLGGEVENPNWKALWPGKQLYDSEGQLAIEVTKGKVPEGDPGAANKVDGLSGATITSRGVSNLIRYWVSDNAFGPYLEKLKQGGGGNG